MQAATNKVGGLSEFFICVEQLIWVFVDAW